MDPILEFGSLVWAGGAQVGLCLSLPSGWVHVPTYAGGIP